FAALMALAPSRAKGLGRLLFVLAFAGNLAVNALMWGREAALQRPWFGFGTAFALRLYPFSSFILMAVAVVTLAVAVYTQAFAAGKPYAKALLAWMTLTLSLVNGAVLADDLLVMLLFWEAIMFTVFVMIKLGSADSGRTATKAVVIAGLTDLCMMLGIGLIAHLAGTTRMQGLRIAVGGANGQAIAPYALAAFALMFIGASSKAGAMPFHSWIPDAAGDAPMPFMALMPGAIEKLLGIYLTVRVCWEFFDIAPGSPVSVAIMVIGGATLIFAVMMALIQKDFKRLLSYHAISQVGYMVLGIGTMLPVGIVGALFHMLNNAVYKCCLFLTAGAVERQAGGTDMKKISGLGRAMPVTMASFLIAAASIAGFPMTNGFFSKELIFDGALEAGIGYYVVALVGAFFTSVSFLKLGHAAFFGKRPAELSHVKEAPAAMLIPMAALAAGCVALGLSHAWAVGNLFMPALGHAQEAGHIGGTNWTLVIISLAVMALAVVDHIAGFKKTGKGIEAADHIHYAPGLHAVYNLAERKAFDPYVQVGRLVKGYARISLAVNDAISYFYDACVPRAIAALSGVVKWAHNGSQARYVLWSLFGLALVAAIYLWSV
ncbi:MAG: NADH-quinone oxidoreductase subunit L, partial [Clostridiales bacterium]|nr:NADH-quinone oxidoreductase subunit L [Clostridiales bacterium]